MSQSAFFCFYSTNCTLSVNLLPVHLFLLSAIFFSFCSNNLQVCYVFCQFKLCPCSDLILNGFKIDFSLSSQVQHSWNNGDKAFCTLLCCFYLEGKTWLKFIAFPVASDSTVLAFLGKSGWRMLLKGTLQLPWDCLDLCGVPQVWYHLHPWGTMLIFFLSSHPPRYLCGNAVCCWRREWSVWLPDREGAHKNWIALLSVSVE